MSQQQHKATVSSSAKLRARLFMVAAICFMLVGVIEGANRRSPAVYIALGAAFIALGAGALKRAAAEAESARREADKS